MVLLILMGLAMGMVNQVKMRALKAATLNDATQLKNAIINFSGENQRFPRVSATDDTILRSDQYSNLISILRGESSSDNRRKKVYLSKARLNFNEGSGQFKCQLIPQFRSQTANFWVILDVSDNGINIGSGRTLNDPVLVFGTNDTTDYGGKEASSVSWTEVFKSGVATATF